MKKIKTKKIWKKNCCHKEGKNACRKVGVIFKTTTCGVIRGLGSISKFEKGWTQPKAKHKEVKRGIHRELPRAANEYQTDEHQEEVPERADQKWCLRQ